MRHADLFVALEREACDEDRGLWSPETCNGEATLGLHDIRVIRSFSAAAELRDLRIPPGNRLEALKGDLQGMHSIRINDQWRVLFRWDSGDVHEVAIIDYH